MITHDVYKKLLGEQTLGKARKSGADMLLDATFKGDIQYQFGYFFDYYHTTSENRLRLEGFNPEEDPNPVPIDLKFIAHTQKTYEKDSVTMHLQFRPGQECTVDYYAEMFGNRYGADFPVGLYCWLSDERGIYRRWLVVATADRYENQFPTWEILRCDNVYRWIKNGKLYEFPGVSRSQNSQIVRFMRETLCRKLSYCWKDSYVRVNQQRSQLSLLERSTSKVRQVSENGSHLSLNDMVLICSKLIGDNEKIYLINQG